MKKIIVTLAIVFIFLIPLASGPALEDRVSNFNRYMSDGNEFLPSGWQDTDSGNGAPLPGTLNGLRAASGTSVIDYSHSAYIGVDPPLGWSSEEFEADLDHLSMWVDDVLVNPELDAYHEEHWFLTDHPEYNYDPFFIPDAWTFVKNDAVPSGTQHPQHGYFEINRVASAGYDASSGWRFDGNLDSGAIVNPTNGFYMSQQIPMVWRDVYSAEISFQYYVSSTSTLNDEVFISTSLEGYVSKYHVFELGTPMDTWLQASATVSSSYFESLPLTNALLFNIGLGTDINGNPSSADHEVFIDEIELRLSVRWSMMVPDGGFIRCRINQPSVLLQMAMMVKYILVQRVIWDIFYRIQWVDYPTTRLWIFYRQTEGIFRMYGRLMLVMVMFILILLSTFLSGILKKENSA